MNKKAPQYAFKIYDSQTLVDFMKELNIPLSLSQIKNPCTSDVRKTLAGIVEALLDKSYDKLEQLTHSAPRDDLVSPVGEVEPAFAELELFVFTHKLMLACGVYDYSMNDILNPTSKRFITLLSGAVNFAKFRENELEEYQAILAAQEQVFQRKIDLENQLETTTQQLNQLDLVKSKEEPVINELRRDTEKQAILIKDHIQRQTDLVGERKALRTMAETTQLKTNEAGMHLHNLEQECQHLRDQIVTNPDELRFRIEELKQEITDCKTESETSNVRNQECREQLESIKKISEGTDKAIKSLNEYTKEKQKYNDIKADTKQKRLDIDEKKDELSDLQGKSKHLNRQILNMSEKFDRMSLEHEQKKAHCDEMLQDAKRTKSLIDDNNEKLRGMIRQNERNLEEMRARIEHTKKKHLHQLIQIQNQYAELEAVVLNYNRQLFDAAGAKQTITTGVQ